MENDDEKRNETHHAAHINRELKALGIEERITQGRGYVYFYGGEEASGWYSSSIAVCYVADLVRATLAETMIEILKHRTFLMEQR